MKKGLKVYWTVLLIAFVILLLVSIGACLYGIPMAVSNAVEMHSDIVEWVYAGIVVLCGLGSICFICYCIDFCRDVLSSSSDRKELF